MRNPYYPPPPYAAYPPYGSDEMTLKDKLQYSLLGIIVLGGAFIIGRNAVRKATANNEQRKTLDEGSAATYAKQIKMAFDNDGYWGTDKDALRAAIRAIPTKAAVRDVMTSYQKLYNASLLSDMQSELKATEYNEMLYIVAAKPENTGAQQSGITMNMLDGWARRLKAAFDITYSFIPGTDEAAIKAVFLEIPTQSVFNQVAAVYRNLFGNDLLTDLKSELEFWEIDDYMKIIYDKPKV